MAKDLIVSDVESVFRPSFWHPKKPKRRMGVWLGGSNQVNNPGYYPLVN